MSQLQAVRRQNFRRVLSKVIFSQGQRRAGGEVESAARNYIDFGQPRDLAPLAKVGEIFGYQQKGNDESEGDKIGADVQIISSRDFGLGRPDPVSGWINSI
tara:strand:+ start:6517 stop:6819 length:303 start_codon:yes stop_codon:yes gene_type:complete